MYILISLKCSNIVVIKVCEMHLGTQKQILLIIFLSNQLIKSYEVLMKS